MLPSPGVKFAAEQRRASFGVTGVGASVGNVCVVSTMETSFSSSVAVGITRGDVTSGLIGDIGEVGACTRALHADNHMKSAPTIPSNNHFHMTTTRSTHALLFACRGLRREAGLLLLAFCFFAAGRSA